MSEDDNLRKEYKLPHRFFNHPELLSQETQDKIQTAIKELNYQQDNLARILVTGESNLVGIIFPHLHLSFYTELLNQLIHCGKEKGYNFIIYTSNHSKEEELKLIQNLISYRIKGLILLSHLLSVQEIEQLPVPVISIERAGGKFKQINNDNFTGGKLAANLLIRNGCEVFIHINTEETEIKAGDGVSFELKFKIDLEHTDADKMLLYLRCGEGKKTVCTFDFRYAELSVDRSSSDGWSVGTSHSVMYLTGKKELDVHIFSDQSSLEIFTDNYQNNHSNNIFAGNEQNGIKMCA